MKLLRLQFWKARRALAPSARFKVALWSKLSARWDAKHLPKYAWYQTHWFRLSSAVTAGFMMVASCTTGAYAYVSPEVTEGTLLYPVKQALEKLEESAQITPAAKAKFYLKKISRRAAERAVLDRQQRKAKTIEREPSTIKLHPPARNHLEQRELRLQKKTDHKNKPNKKKIR